MSILADTLVQGRVTQTLAAVADDQLPRLGEVRALLNELFQGDWDAGTAYTIGQSVNSGGAFYIANLANTNKEPSANPTEWRLAANKGASSYTYIRYATDTSGTGFSTSPSGKTHVAFLTSATAIASPVVGDFAGLWVQFVGTVTTTTTDSITEGATNLYHTVARVRATVLTGLATGSGGVIAATDTILQAFGKAENRLAVLEARTTTNVTEGTNLYYTDARARAALSATSPATYNSSTGAIGINAASANTVSYVVQRDANGDFAARKIVLGTSTAADHLTFGTAATLGYTAGAATFNVPVSATEFLLAGADAKFSVAGGEVALYATGASENVFITDGSVLIVTELKLTGLAGVLQATSGVVSGSATTTAIPEGTNLYYTEGRADARADARITVQKGAANGLASLGSDSKLTTGQIPAAVLGGTIYQGTWNANTNSPALVTATGTKGYYYVVSTAGTTNLDGVASWALGDWAIYNGTAWQKVDNTDAVLSVNTLLGAVVLVTDDIAEDGSPVNLWFTTARVLATALTGFSSTTGAITAADTVLTLANKTQGRLAVIEAWTTANLPEVTNLFYTDARVLARAVAGLGVTLIAPALGTSGSPYALSVTGGAHTTLAASAEASDVVINLDRIVQFSTGALTTQRAVRITNPKYAFVATSTLATASTVEIAGPPHAWSNATITTGIGLKISAGAVSAGNTNTYGLYVDAPTGGVTNYCAAFVTGNVGIGTAAPTTLLDILGDTVRLRTARTPASAAATGAVGEICWDASYLYICTATNTWKRSAIATW